MPEDYLFSGEMSATVPVSTPFDSGGYSGNDSGGSGLVGMPTVKDWIGYGLNALHNVVERDFNRKEAQKARDWQEEMWMKNNEYNSPVNQRARLEEAGLNPYLMYGVNGATGQATVPTASVGAHSSTPADYHQMAVTTANARLLGAQASNQEIENDYKEMLLIREINEMSSREYLNYIIATNKNVDTQILCKELAHWDEAFTNSQNKILADINELDNIQHYRDATIAVEKSKLALERWKRSEESRIALIEDRTRREVEMTRLNEQSREFNKQLNQADEHFKQSLDVQNREIKQRYWQMGVDAFTDVLRTVGNVLTFGVAGVGSNNSKSYNYGNTKPGYDEGKYGKSSYPNYKNEEEYVRHLRSLNRK